MFQTTPSYRKGEIVDELAEVAEFNLVKEFSDAFYDAIFFAYSQISDLDALREKFKATPKLKRSGKLKFSGCTGVGFVASMSRTAIGRSVFLPMIFWKTGPIKTLPNIARS